MGLISEVIGRLGAEKKQGVVGEETSWSWLLLSHVFRVERIETHMAMDILRVFSEMSPCSVTYLMGTSMCSCEKLVWLVFDGIF